LKKNAPSRTPVSVLGKKREGERERERERESKGARSRVSDERTLICRLQRKLAIFLDYSRIGRVALRKPRSEGDSRIMNSLPGNRREFLGEFRSRERKVGVSRYSCGFVTSRVSKEPEPSTFIIAEIGEDRGTGTSKKGTRRGTTRYPS